jgi:5-hydroxyisourate hydrolase-like protein (transthyretin family)
MKLSTHVLDTARGRPAAGVRVTVELRDGDGGRGVGGGSPTTTAGCPACSPGTWRPAPTG